MQRFLALAGLCLAVFLAMTGMGLIVAALPEKYLRCQGGLHAAGWLSASFALASMACQYPAGRLADRVGARFVLAAGFALMAGSAVTYALAETPPWLFAGRALQGAGEAPVWALAPAVLARLYPERRGRVMGLYNAAFHLGLMAGPLLGAWGAARLAGDPFTAFGWLCLAAMGLALVVPYGRPGRATAGVARAGVARLPRVLLALLPALPLAGAAYGLLTSSLPVHLAGQAGYDSRALAWVFFQVYAGIALSQGLAGRLSDRLGRLPFLVGGLAVMAAGLWGATASARGLGQAAFPALGLGLGAFTVASLALVNDRCPATARGRACGLYYLVWGLGYCAGPLVANSLGLPATVAILAALALAAAVLVGWTALGPGSRPLAD
ncbi:MAG: MFS transporter [Solidesulfovibrio sp. DCME]|uniref:MFS transporter n=1 Tax=Solidesulfovibrio sp. DCME TaxID=3447380 RepID=UPI003D0A791E